MSDEPVPLDYISNRPPAAPIYLGDGAYASFDGFNIWLLANHHDPLRATDKVALAPETIVPLIDYIKRFWIIPGKE